MKRRIISRIVSALLLLALIYVVVTAIGIECYGKTDEKTPSDVAIVLGAGTTDGQVSPVYRERINHGIWLYENQYVDYLILTGGIGEGNTYSDAYTAKQYAIGCGVPESVIYIEEVSTITEENLQQAKIIMQNQGWQRAILVSDPMHMKRAMLMASDFGIAAVSSPTPTTMYRTWKTKLPFLARELFFYIGYCVLRPFR